VEVFDWFKCSVLMFEKTSLPIWTEQPFTKSSAYFRLILWIHWGILPYEFIVSMSKLTLIPISTSTNLNPIFAHLSFILSLINFLLHLLLHHHFLTTASLCHREFIPLSHLSYLSIIESINFTQLLLTIWLEWSCYCSCHLLRENFELILILKMLL
jgi:hypothetical protein